MTTLLIPLVLLMAHAARTLDVETLTLCQQAVADAAPEGTRVVVEVLTSRVPRGCRVAQAQVRQPWQPGSTAWLTVSGLTQTSRGQPQPCQGDVLVRAEVTRLSLTLVRSVARGEPLTDAVSERWLEVKGNPITGRDIPPGVLPNVVASRPLSAGTVLDARHIMLRMPPAGTSVPVVLNSGALALRGVGTLVACTGLRACARLPNGKVVEGPWKDGALQMGATALATPSTSSGSAGLP